MKLGKVTGKSPELLLLYCLCSFILLSQRREEKKKKKNGSSAQVVRGKRQSLLQWNAKHADLFRSCVWMLAAAAALPEGVAAKKGNNHDATKKTEERALRHCPSRSPGVYIWLVAYFLLFPVLFCFTPHLCAAPLCLRRLTAVIILFLSDGDKNLNTRRIKCLSQKKIIIKDSC